MQRANPLAASPVIGIERAQRTPRQMIRNINNAQQRTSVVEIRIVVRERFADVRAHQRLLAALFVVVALRERRLAEARDGQILFVGVQGERGRGPARQAEEGQGAFHWVHCAAAGDAAQGCLPRDGGDGGAAAFGEA